MSRPDLQQFANRQPSDALETAMLLAQQARLPDYAPTYPSQHYVTTDLWNRRNAKRAPAWLRRMTPIATVGRHVALMERREDSP